MKYLNLKIVDGIGVVVFNDPEANVNTFNAVVVEEVEKMASEIEKNPAIKAGVIISGKDNCFVAGADIKLLRDVKTQEEGNQVPLLGHRSFFAIENCSKPIVAAIKGPCLGGGLELAMACHYRIAADDKKTILGLPEVMLGVFPGGGGTQRLPKLVGIQAALDMMLTGKNIRPKKALQMGLIDDTTTPWGLENTAIEVAKKLAEGKLNRRKRKISFLEKMLEGNGLGRKVLFSKARKILKSKTKGLYPAPEVIIDCVEAGANNGPEAGYAHEAKSFGKMVLSFQSKHLIGLFFGQTALKKNRYGKPSVTTNTVAVLGAGLMGTGITLINAQKGIVTILKDLDLETIGKGLKYIYTALNKRVKSRALSAFDRDLKMAQIYPKINYDGFENVDLIIEAATENLPLKQQILKEVEEIIKPTCIFATNTSALPIAEIAKASIRPENVIGMHYFSPVEKMPLLEVVVHPGSSKETCARAVDFGIRQGKTVIVVKDSPGFYTTRILAPYLDETILLGLEGNDLSIVDKALTKIGFPVGGVTLADEVGLDTATKICIDLKSRFGSRLMQADTAVLKEMTGKGFMGKKSGKGYFDYSHANPKNRPINAGALSILEKYKIPNTQASLPKDMQNRCLLRMVNEAVYCLQEEVIINVVDGDIGAVFGLGFPPIYGGPFRYIDFIGADKIVAQLLDYESKFGKRFTPCPLLVEMANTHTPFYNKETEVIIEESLHKLSLT